MVRVNPVPPSLCSVVTCLQSCWPALATLFFLHSNAECEKVFSKVNLFKTKPRNKLKTKTVNGALLSASCIKGSGGSCIQFTPSKDMFSRINNHAQLFQHIRGHELDLEKESYIYSTFIIAVNFLEALKLRHKFAYPFYTVMFNLIKFCLTKGNFMYLWNDLGTDGV